MSLNLGLRNAKKWKKTPNFLFFEINKEKIKEGRFSHICILDNISVIQVKETEHLGKIVAQICGQKLV